jgi:hypothetical protein
MAKKPRNSPNDPFSLVVRPEDVAEIQRIAAENPLDPRLWVLAVPSLGYEDDEDGEPEPKPNEPKPV